MKIEIEINNLSKSPVKIFFLESVIRKTLKEGNFFYLAKKNILVSVALVTPENIKNLNKTYRKKDFVTDVLSFSEFKNNKDLQNFLKKDLFLGEIILCYNDIVEYCKKNNLNINIELAKVLSHGILHLLGFNHGKKMFKIQEKIAREFE